MVKPTRSARGRRPRVPRVRPELGRSGGLRARAPRTPDREPAQSRLAVLDPGDATPRVIEPNSDVDPMNPVPVGRVIEPRCRIAYGSPPAASLVASVGLAERARVRAIATGRAPDGRA